MKVKGEYSARCQVKTGVPQGSLLGVLLFNVYLSDMFDSVQADVNNFADDNNLSTVGNTIDEAKTILITDTEAAINWIEVKPNDCKPRKVSFDVPFCKHKGPNKSTNYKYQGDLFEK